MNNKITHKVQMNTISYYVGIISCFGVQNNAIEFISREDEFFNRRAKFISVLVISAQTMYNTA